MHYKLAAGVAGAFAARILFGRWLNRRVSAGKTVCLRCGSHERVVMDPEFGCSRCRPAPAYVECALCGHWQALHGPVTLEMGLDLPEACRCYGCECYGFEPTSRR